MNVQKKYLIWFPLRPKRCKWSNDLRQAKRYCDKQKIEACINSNVGKDNEDTVYSNGVNDIAYPLV